jgi:hypothetical protein
MQASLSTTKYGFRIRTRRGLLVENLMIHGRDEADAERKLRQMYQHCEIIKREVVQSAKSAEHASFEEIVALVTRQRPNS